jgi:hypothetical protein
VSRLARFRRLALSDHKSCVVRKNQPEERQRIEVPETGPADEGAFFNPAQVSYHQLRAKSRLDKVEANAQLELHTKTLMERMSQVEERAFAGDPMAMQSFISDARQMVTEFRQARVLFPKERVSYRCSETVFREITRSITSVTGRQILRSVKGQEDRSVRISGRHGR